MTRLLPAVAAIVAAVAVGCGSADNDPNLAQAAERTEAAGSGRFELVGAIAEKGTPASLSCTGSADYERRRVRVRCLYEGSGTLEMIAVGRDYYLRGDFAGSGLKDKWLKETGEVDEDNSLASFSPQKLLAVLRKASSGTERIGDEEVRGVSTIRYRLTVDCQSADLECPESAPVEVWIAEDRIVRRIAIDDDTGEATIEFFDLGVDVDIDRPPDKELIDEVASSQAGVVTRAAIPCAEGDAVPISQVKLVATLRRHGVNVRNDAKSCVVSNADGDAQDVLAREGIVYCSVHAEPPAGARRTVTRRGVDGADAELLLENIECTIFTDSPTAETRIDRLEAAFEDLERSIRP